METPDASKRVDRSLHIRGQCTTGRKGRGDDKLFKAIKSKYYIANLKDWKGILELYERDNDSNKEAHEEDDDE